MRKFRIISRILMKSAGIESWNKGIKEIIGKKGLTLTFDPVKALKGYIFKKMKKGKSVEVEEIADYILLRMFYPKSVESDATPFMESSTITGLLEKKDKNKNEQFNKILSRSLSNGVVEYIKKHISENKREQVNYEDMEKGLIKDPKNIKIDEGILEKFEDNFETYDHDIDLDLETLKKFSEFLKKKDELIYRVYYLYYFEDKKN